MSEWRTVKGFPDYQISDNGNLKSNKNGKTRIIKPWKNSDGHLQVGLFNNGKHKKLLHRIIAEAFIPNPENKPIVRHLNDIPDDNRLENLAWGDSKDNASDSIRNNTHLSIKLRKPVIVLKDNYYGRFESGEEASRVLNIPSTHISEVISGRRKTTYGYIFKNPKPRHIGKPKNK